MSRRDDGRDVVWFLDVDGVLNAAGDLVRDGYEHRQVSVHGWPVTVTFQPEVVRRVDAIGRAARVVWVTTWREDAVHELAPALAIDTVLEVAPDPDDGRSYASLPSNPLGHRWWKLGAVLDFLRLNPARAVVWTDDDLSDAVRAEFRASFRGPSLLMAPSPDDGLTTEQISRIERFVASPQEST